MIGIDYLIVICICKDAGFVMQYLNPFCFGAQDDTRSSEEECFFLHAAAVGHYDTGVSLEGEDVKK